MIILGLTGSIGMGKSTTAAMLRRLRVPVHDADRTVHVLLAPGGRAVAAVAAAFGDDVLADGGVNRRALGAKVFNDTDALRRLESILHPLVRHSEHNFLATAARRRTPLVALDVPLLFETGGARRVDATLVVTAPWFVQRSRVMARPGMTIEKLRTILLRQLPDSVKRRHADYVLATGLGRNHALCALKRIVRRVVGGKASQWPPHPFTFRKRHA